MGFFDRFRKKKNQQSTDNEAEGHSDSDALDFKYLDDLIHSGQKEIHLNSDIILNRNESVDYLNGIQINVDDIIIDANGHSIDGNELRRIFTVSGKNVTIRNMTLKNGEDKNGGAIYNSGKLEIYNCKFLENRATNIGGAIYNDEDLTVIKSIFFKNYSKRNGGAIGNNGDLTIENSKLSENRSIPNGSGGTISNTGNLIIRDSPISKSLSKYGGSLSNSKDGTLKLINSPITHSSARTGGAIKNSGNIIINNSDIHDNDAKWDGAAIHNRGKFKIVGSAVFNNSAKRWGIIFNESEEQESYIQNCKFCSNEDMLIWNRSGELTIEDSCIRANSSPDKEAIKNSGMLKIIKCNFTANIHPHTIINENYLDIYNSFFSHNHADCIISNEETDNSILGIFGGKFNDNDLNEDVIHNAGKSCTVSKTSFENNLSNDSSQNIRNHSKLILIAPEIEDARESILNLGKTTIEELFDGFESKIKGQGIVQIAKTDSYDSEFSFSDLDEKIHNDSCEIVLKEDYCLNELESKFYEGGIELDIDNLVIDGNGKTIDASNLSRIFIITGNNIKLKNIIFKNGLVEDNYYRKSNIHGGAIQINNYSDLTIENCKFLNNSSENNGGAIQVNRDANTVMKNCEFKNNTSNYDGGAINNNGETCIMDSTLYDNIAKKPNATGGGAIMNSYGNLNIENSKFCRNSASRNSSGHRGYGGAILNYKASLSIEECDFLNNFAEWWGAAIKDDYGDVAISNCKFLRNKAVVGAIHGQNSKFLIKNCQFLENDLSKEDAVTVFDGDVDMENCTFKNKEIKEKDIDEILENLDNVEIRFE